MEHNDDLRKRRELSYVAVSCSNCDGAAWLPAHSFGATIEDFPLKPHWQEMTIPAKTYLPVDGGLCLKLTGHYGGFTDDIHGELANVVLCHDCSVQLARALPGVFTKHTGHHSMSDIDHEEHNGKSCCEFAWTIDDSGCTAVGDGNGGWIQKYDSEGNQIFPDA